MTIVTVGLATMEVIQRMSGPVLVGGKAVSDSVELVAGGPAANAAVTAAALLGRADLITALGSGFPADIVDADLAEHNVRVHDCSPISGWSVPVATSLVNASGERTVVSPGAWDTDFALTAEARDAIARATVLLLDGHHPTLAEQALAARGPGCLVMLDAGSLRPLVEAWLPRVDVLVASSEYANNLGISAAQVCARGLLTGARSVIVSQGAGPVVSQIAGGEVLSVPVPQVPVRETLAAGDAFHGALAAELAVALRSPDPLGRSSWRDVLPTAIAAAAQVATVRVAHVGSRAWLAAL